MPNKPETFETRRAPVADHARNLVRVDRKAVYNSTRWAALRRIVLDQEPVCRRCMRVPSSHVDHIQPLHVHPHLAFERSNLQGLCAGCHTIKTIEERKAND